MNARKIVPIIALVAVLIIGFFIINKRGAEEPIETSPPIVKRDVRKKAEPVVEEYSEYRAPRFIQDVTKLTNDPNNKEELSELAQGFLNPDATEEELVMNLERLVFNLSLYANGGSLPGAFNIDIANGLLGDNKRKVAYLPADSIRLNEHGELIDSWGTPYEFHCESLKMADVRSAGPDKLHYTDDDIIIIDPADNIDSEDE